MELSIRELGRRPRVAEFALKHGEDIYVTYYNRLIAVLVSADEYPRPRPDSWRQAPKLWQIRMARKMMTAQIDPEFIRCDPPGRDVLLSAGIFYAVEHGAQHALDAIRAAQTRAVLDFTELTVRECRVRNQRYRQALERFEYEEKIEVIKLSEVITARARMLMDMYGAHAIQTIGLRIDEALLAAVAMEYDRTLLTSTPFRLLQLPGLKLGYLTPEGVVDLTTWASQERIAVNPPTYLNGDMRYEFFTRYRDGSRKGEPD